MTQITRIAIGLGSSKSDRLGLLARAAHKLQEDLVSDSKASSVYESPAWGGIAKNPFLNSVVVGSTDWKPPAIVNFLKNLERELGRTPAPRYADRELDLDLLVYGDKVWNSEGIQVPHLGLAERAFVLIPLVELWPGWVDPIKKKSAQELLDLLPETSRRETIKIGPLPPDTKTP